jgi:hypothetical protein
MATLDDFYTSGAATLADVTYEAGEITSGQRVLVPLSKTATDVDVTITTHEGHNPDDRVNTFNRRVKFSTPFEWPEYTAREITTQASDLLVRMTRNEDTNSPGLTRTTWTVESQPASGSWTYATSSTIAYMTNPNQTKGYRIVPQLTGGENYVDTIICGVEDAQNGIDLAYVTKNVSAYSKGGNFDVDKLGYMGDATWLNSVSNGEVVYHIVHNNSSAVVELAAQVIDEVDTVNKRTTTLHGSPSGTTGVDDNASKTFKFLTKGYKMTQVEQGTNITSTWPTVSFDGATTYSNDWNQYTGCVIKFWDGVDPTAYRVATIQQANGTTNATLTNGVEYGGYVYSDGSQANWEIWTFYDFTADLGTDPVLIDTMSSGTWAHTVGCAVLSTAGTTTPFQGSFIFYRPDDWYLSNVGVEFKQVDFIESVSSMNPDPTVQREYQHVVTDWSNMTYRDGSIVGRTTPILKGEAFMMDWITGVLGDSTGHNWYQYMKDTRETGSALGHTSMSTTNNQFSRRRTIKYESGTWWINTNDDSVNHSHNGTRFTDPDGFFAVWEGEDWQIQADLTVGDIENAIIAQGRYNDFFSTGSHAFNEDSVWMYNDIGDDCMVMYDTDRFPDIADHSGALGYQVYGINDMTSIRGSDFRWSLSETGDYVSVTIHEPTNNKTNGSITQTSTTVEPIDTIIGKTRVVVKGS